MATILLIHDQSAAGGVLFEMIERLRHEVIETDSAEEAIACASRGNAAVDVVILDHHSHSHWLIETLTELQSQPRLASLPMVVLTADDVKSDDVIEAMRLGAFDHLTRPLGLDELSAVVHRALSRPKQPDAAEPASGGGERHDDRLVGVCAAMRRVEKLIGLAAASDATVLVQGETGTGKSTVARAIHAYSEQRDNPLTVVECTAIPEDYESFQSLAPGACGTVILDEIGDLNAQMQAKLVRALKEMPVAPVAGSAASSPDMVPPRIIATTQYDLIAMVREKRFREDLYYRLNVMGISLPPLRERGSDILFLAETFLQQAKPDAPKRLSSGAAKALLDYAWPGNLWELQNLMYHLCVTTRAAVIEETDLGFGERGAGSSSAPAGDGNGMDYYASMAALEKQLLLRALTSAGGRRAEAARLLGINRQLLYAKLKSHGLMNELKD